MIMTEEDAEFEASIAMAIAKIESAQAMPNDPIAKMYALLWCAAYSVGLHASGKDLFRQASMECADNYPWMKDIK